MTFIYEDSTETISFAETILVDQREFLDEIEKRHTDLLIIADKIRFDVENLREKLLEEKSTNDKIEKSIEEEKRFQREIGEENRKNENFLLKNFEKIFNFLFDLKNLIDEIRSIENFIEKIRSEIEKRRKSFVRSEIDLLKLKKRRRKVQRIEIVPQIQIRPMKKLSKSRKKRRQNQIENLRRKQNELVASIRRIKLHRIRRSTVRFPNFHRVEKKASSLKNSS